MRIVEEGQLGGQRFLFRDGLRNVPAALVCLVDIAARDFPAVDDRPRVGRNSRRGGRLVRFTTARANIQGSEGADNEDNTGRGESRSEHSQAMPTCFLNSPPRRTQGTRRNGPFEIFLIEP